MNKPENINKTAAETLELCLTIIDRLSEEFRTVAEKHSSFTNGEFKQITAVIEKLKALPPPSYTTTIQELIDNGELPS